MLKHILFLFLKQKAMNWRIEHVLNNQQVIILCQWDSNVSGK